MRGLTLAFRERSLASVREAWTDTFCGAAAGIPFLIATVGGVVLAILAPFGMAPVPIWMRLPYWIVVLNVGTLVGIVFSVLVRRSDWCEARPLMAAGLVGVAMTPPLSLIVWYATEQAFGPGQVRPVTLVFNVFVISAVMLAVNLLADRTPVQTHALRAADADEAPPPLPRFLERMPPRLRGADLYALEAEDHYLRLHTSRGSDLILMRLSDAVGELAGVEGAQTHRSWWVARNGVRNARRTDGRAILALKDGSEAPVSRTYAKALRQAGWF